jgi:coenzyme PQQ precursor peptide PqqA
LLTGPGAHGGIERRRPQPPRQGASTANRRRRTVKKWKTPRVVEISCGCEINAYFPAEL